VSATTVQLLRAASEIVGGDEALANRLGISKRLLSKFMADRPELPDPVLLRALDIVLAGRESRLGSTGELALQSAQEFRRGR
jgi:hypothetical protein